ncbi:zincin [Exidia glandulosa HHB12029]|uniref:Zincin n=1 Tax=Exidia glandulosa HHB12029 TaxID=1314781 RepID=A0A165GZR0_EXIGL|nr:zincin [Exidia glandulosa HHB12029]
MSAVQPPQAAPLWNHTPESLKAELDAVLASARSKLDAIVSLPPSERTFAALAELEATLSSRGEPLTFYQNVSTDGELRDASEKAENALKEFGIEREMRVDLFEVLKDASTRTGPLSGDSEDARFVEKVLLEGKRAGLELPEEQRKELELLKKELSRLCVTFQKNYGQEKGKIAFSVEELEGVPPPVVSGYAKREDDAKCELTFRPPDIMPLFKYAKNPETRRKAWEAYESRVAVNEEIFDSVLAIRRKIADLLGYDSWADYVTEVKMVKSAQGVHDFISDVESKLLPVGKRDREQLLALKEEEEGADSTEFYMWDWFYYDRLYVERTLDLDDALVKEYFPVEVVVPTIMKVYETMLGVEFVPLSNDVDKGDVWHPDVQRFALWDSRGDGFLGYAYLDLYPREAKFPHAAVWSLVPGFTRSDGSRSYPVCAMVANLAKSTPDRPALMTHASVVTFFHEMGHVFHNILSKTKYSRFDGTSVANDFVEAPSKMLENWCWVPSVLEKMSSHYKTKEPLPSELIEKIVKSRYVNVGMSMLRQLFLAKYDITVHTAKEPENYTKLWNRIREDTSLVKGPAIDAPGQAAFAHLMGGYEAGYYGYTYSSVFAADMFRTVFAKDPLSPQAGRLYREEILRPGGSRDEMDSLKAFLGRPPNAEAFLEQLLGAPQ